MDQVSRPMQIALVAVVLLAGMWFTVLKPKSADSSSSAPVAQTQTQSSQPVAPGVKGLTSAIDKAKAASATSDATNAKIQSATGGSASASASASSSSASTATATAAPKHSAVAKKAAATATRKKAGTKAATAKAVASKPAATKTSTAKPAAATAAKPAADVDPSARLLAYLKQGKTLVVLFYGKGADDKAARKAVHLTAKADPKNVVSAYVPISKVGSYEAITSDIDVLAAPTILVISTTGKATPLTGYVDAAVVRDAVAAARTAAAAPATK